MRILWHKPKQQSTILNNLIILPQFSPNELEERYKDCPLFDLYMEGFYEGVINTIHQIYEIKNSYLDQHSKIELGDLALAHSCAHEVLKNHGHMDWHGILENIKKSELQEANNGSRRVSTDTRDKQKGELLL